MTSADAIKKQLTNVLNESAKNLKLNQYSINVDLNALKGDGFLGEFYKVSITDKETNTLFHLAVKKAPLDEARREENSIELVYHNEIFFYSKVYPALKKFEEEHQVSQPFNAIPEYIASNSEIGNEILVFEDISKAGFVLREKDLLLNEEHVKLIFKTYGHFHSLSFCLKQQRPEEFQRLALPLHGIWQQFAQKDSFINVLTQIQQKAFESLNPDIDGPVMAKFRKYLDDTKGVFLNCSNYHGDYFGILHGDCWSNNMMFKYKDSEDQSKPVAINLLDFQLAMTGTPVYDLSYFFYTGGCKRLFDRLEDYLDTYYEQFSKSAKRLGCDPNTLLPREALSSDWKAYSKFGMLLALILTKIKLMTKKDSIEMIESVGKEDVDQSTFFMKIPYDEKLFRQRVRDIIVHMYEIGAL